MKKLIYTILFLSLLSCQNLEHKKVHDIVSTWQNVQIQFPNDTSFISYSKKYNAKQVHLLNGDFTILSYIDSTGCMSCKLRLDEWGNFIHAVDTITQKTVPLIFIFQTQRKNDLIHFLKRVEFEYPVCIDTNSSFEHLNHFPKDERFQTFLLDKEHRVIAIGNPIYNPRIKELYLKIIKGETITNNYSTALTTTTSINHTTINLGEFDWRQEQTGTFILSNTGSRPLVIEMINTSCGCTTVEYEKEPVHPGESTALQVTYKAEQPEHFNKTITVYCNAEESPIKLKVSGNAI